MSAVKRRTLGVLLAVATVLTITVTPALAATGSAPEWVLQENVDLSDSSRWVAETGQAANTSSYDLPKNVSFGQSGITVHGAAETHGTAKYTSGDAKGVDIRIPNYARVEAKGSVPFGSGLWPALMWLRPLDSASGEIDLMEVFGPDARVAATIHNEYGPTHKSLQGSARWSTFANASPTASHTYVMEKTPKRIKISVDGTVILDAGPEDVRPGFNWDAIFERPGAVWYPRVTLQIGCAVSEPDCGIGLPAAGWQGGDVKLTSLRIWKLGNASAPSGQPVSTPSPAPKASLTPGQATAPTPPPVAGGSAVSGTTPAAPLTASDHFALTPGKELRRLTPAPRGSTAHAAASFAVPVNLGSGVLYQSVQLPLANDARSGYRATVTLKSSGTIYLTLAWVSHNRSRELHSTVAVARRGSYAPGGRVRVAIAVDKGRVSAKAWPQGAAEPGWQLSGAATVTPQSLGGVLVIGYLSRHAPVDVSAGWTVQRVSA
jgi:hypothetical protein